MPGNTLQHLQDQAHRNLLAFLKAELALGLIFVDATIIERKESNLAGYERNKAEAIKAAETVQRFKERLPAVARREIEIAALKLTRAISKL